jgi:hypothetical protein
LAWAIVRNTPLWVWGVLAALGLAQARNRKVSSLLILLLPATMIPLSLYGVAASFGASLGVLSAWAIGLGAALTLNGLVFLGPRGARYDAVEGRFEVPGSWVPLMLILTIFSTRFVFAVTKALNPSIVGGDLHRMCERHPRLLQWSVSVASYASAEFAAWCPCLMRRVRIGSWSFSNSGPTVKLPVQRPRRVQGSLRGRDMPSA